MSKPTPYSLLKESFQEWSQDNVSRLAAALAYYTIFSLAPLLVIVISIVGILFGRTRTQAEVAHQVQGLVGEKGADFIATMVQNAAKTGSGSAMIIGIVLLLYGATNVFASLQDSLNTIWEVKPKPGQGFWLTIKNRLMSFAMILGVAFLLVVSLILSTAIAAATKYFGGQFPSFFWRGVELAISLSLFTLIFASIYKILPDVNIGWRSVWTGALLTSILFTVGKWLIGLYLARSSTINVYGAAGSLVIILLWIYYAAQILFFGAEFTQVYARQHGHWTPTSENAVKLSETERVHQGLPHSEKHPELTPPPAIQS